MKYLILCIGLLACLTLTAQQPCAPDLFYKTIRHNIIGYYGITSAIDTHGDAYVTSRDILTKLDPSGQPLWTKRLLANARVECTKMFGSKDGNLFYFGETFNASGTTTTQTIAKIDPNGNLLWTKSYLPDQSHIFQLYSAVEDTDGSLFAVYYTRENGLSFQDVIVLVKFSASGDMLYSKMHRPIGIRLVETYDVAVKGNFVYVCGYDYFQNGYKGMVVKFNKGDCSLVWTKEYAFNGGGALFTRIIPLNDDRLCLLGADDVNTTDTTILTVINTDGNVLSSRFLGLTHASLVQRAMLMDDGNIIMGQWLPDGFQRLPALVKIDPVNGVVWARKFTGNYIGTPSAIEVDPANRVWLTGSNESGQSNFILRAAVDGTNICPYTEETIKQQQFPVTMVPVSFESANHPLPAINIPMNLNPETAPEITTLCGQCSSLDLGGQPELCSMGDTLKLQVTTSIECAMKPGFIFDQSMWKWVHWENDLAVFVPLKPGTSTIEAFIQTSCSRLSKTMQVTAGIGEAPSLVTDTALCPGSTISLSLPDGYSAYRWPDGSTATNWQVNLPGDYILTVTGGCNQVFSMPMKVRSATVVPVDLGMDTVACGVNPLRLNAGNDYAGYAWNNGSTGQNLVVSQSGTYSVTATTHDGCITTDEINVRLQPKPVDFLPPATELCDSAIIELLPVRNFAAYEWSDGSVDKGITVREPGTYWLNVKDEWNCAGSDSIIIQRTECGEWLMVPTAFTPNRDTRNDRFKPVSKGRLIEYEFSVYNRFGQLIFHSTTPGEGWDGSIKGIAQDSNNFSWKCRYRFQSGPPQFKKGRVILIR